MKLSSCYLEHFDSLGLRHANWLKSYVGGYMCTQNSYLKIIRSAPEVYLIFPICVLYDLYKQWLLPYMSLTGRFYNSDWVCILRGTEWVFNPYPANVEYMVSS
jgi:hypothetical protein